MCTLKSLHEVEGGEVNQPMGRHLQQSKKRKQCGHVSRGPSQGPQAGLEHGVALGGGVARERDGAARLQGMGQAHCSAPPAPLPHTPQAAGRATEGAGREG